MATTPIVIFTGITLGMTLIASTLASLANYNPCLRQFSTSLCLSCLYIPLTLLVKATIEVAKELGYPSSIPSQTVLSIISYGGLYWMGVQGWVNCYYLWNRDDGCSEIGGWSGEEGVVGAVEVRVAGSEVEREGFSGVGSSEVGWHVVIGLALVWLTSVVLSVLFLHEIYREWIRSEVIMKMYTNWQSKNKSVILFNRLVENINDKESTINTKDLNRVMKILLPLDAKVKYPILPLDFLMARRSGQILTPRNTYPTEMCDICNTPLSRQKTSQVYTGEDQPAFPPCEYMRLSCGHSLHLPCIISTLCNFKPFPCCKVYTDLRADIHRIIKLQPSNN